MMIYVLAKKGQETYFRVVGILTQIQFLRVVMVSKCLG